MTAFQVDYAAMTPSERRWDSSEKGPGPSEELRGPGAWFSVLSVAAAILAQQPAASPARVPVREPASVGRTAPRSQTRRVSRYRGDTNRTCHGNSQPRPADRPGRPKLSSACLSSPAFARKAGCKSRLKARYPLPPCGPLLNPLASSRREASRLHRPDAPFFGLDSRNA
jgi:hypothetical protein